MRKDYALPSRAFDCLCANFRMQLFNNCQLLYGIRGSSSEKRPSNMCQMYRFRSSCACTTYHLGLCSPVIHSVVQYPMILLVDGKGPDQTADLSLRCPHYLEDTFSHVIFRLEEMQYSSHMHTH